MKTNQELPPVAVKIVGQIKKTKTTPALTAIVKQAINQRTYLLGHEAEELDHTRALEKIRDKNTRKRTEQLLKEIDRLEDRKAVSAICAVAIEQRKAVRGTA